MKHFSLLVIAFIMLFGTVRSQEWIQNLPQDKLESGTLTFFEIQNAFNDYWEPLNVENGYYELDGEKVKAPYYKQFKRWEWYWETRVNPKTGEFPTKEELDNAYASITDNKSQSGNWTTLGPSTSSGGYAGLGRVNCVAFVPNSTGEYYAGTASGGIWHTINDGTTWTVLNDTTPVIGVSDIIVQSPVVGPDILYIATGDRDGGSLWSLGGGQSNDNNSVGVLKSIDGGATWTTTGLSFTVGQGHRVNRLLMDPNSAYQTIYAATTDGVWKTTNAGTNWTRITTIDFIDLEFKPGDATTIYGSTESWSSTNIYRSTDSGANWVSVASHSGGRRTELAVSANQPTWVYAITSNSSGGLLGIYKSTDSGASYTQLVNGSVPGNSLLSWNFSCDGSGTNNGQGGYDLCIASNPTDANDVFIGGVNTWMSTDGGSNWSLNNYWSTWYCPSYPEVHADKHFLAYQNGTSTLFECNDGGLYKTTNDGASWTHLSSGMAISQIYRIGVSQTAMDEVIIGLQDNGTKARLSGTWNDVIGGDGFECIIDYTNVNTQYGALYYGDIYRTTDHWSNSTQLSVPGNGQGSAAWCTPYLIDPNSNSTLYVGCSSVQKTTNQGSSWSSISTSFGTPLQNMAISISNTNYIYAATHSNIYRTTSGGGPSVTWSNITSNLPTSSADITYIAVKDDDPNHVWVSMGGYNSHGVYETTNGGGSWSNISSGLPSLPLMCVIQNHDYSGIELYAATDAGVYVKQDGGNWLPFSNGLPNVVVAEMEIHYASNPDDNVLYAASFGRGVWKSDLYSNSIIPTADFTGAPTIGIAPLSVAFTDISNPNGGVLATWSWDFGDPASGVNNTSSLQNPSHIYDNPGIYTVSLTVTSGSGGSDTETKVDYITVDYPVPTCDFIADVTSGAAPLTVNFTDLSMDSVDTWSWDFGDGGVSSEENPSYDYSTPGTYTVSLTVSGPGGSDSHTKTDYITVHLAAPVADFTGFPTVGAPPLNVNFTDASTGQVDNWSWDFGDGGTSVEQNPVHQYTSVGTYTVSLTVTGPGGDDTEIKTDYISVSTLPPPAANFSGNPISGFFPLLVNFTDLTIGDVSQWRWYFGDGGTSIIQNPAHTYNNSGNYTVSLKAIGPGGSDSIAKENYITVLVGIEELNTDNMKIYPNPCNEYLMIDSKETVHSIAMADIIGNIVKEELISCPAPCTWKVNMTDLHSGIYFCRISMDDGRMVLIKVLKK